MLKIATVFSGIGSVEWALKSMDINHEIVFACDNGELDIEINDQEEILKQIKKMQTIEEQNKFVSGMYTSNSRRTNFVKKSYLANYDIDENNFLSDIRFIDGTKYRDKVDLFVGGSPCQSFSIMGEQLGFDDTRGTLFYDFARLINEIQPKSFIFENVQGMYRHDKGKTWKTIKQVFSDLGYYIQDTILDAKDFNIPQTRRRLFVVGFKHKNNFAFPNVQPLSYTLQDFLETSVGFGHFKRKNCKLSLVDTPGEVDKKHILSEKVLKHVMSTGTKGYYVKPEIDLEIARPLLATMHKMHRAGVDNYVTQNNKVRRLTPRECLRLMGYDDSFTQAVSDTQMYRQAGNSIVVDVMISLLKSMFEAEPELIE